eukprot:TRINITY_DN7807_c0_g1_i2.p1 TRINITY_DN7807_c0_g1~~TRINITY_DN7807_c0_g1_i2.p1  ORF type:complete len:259 (-),score=76.65 TRINITY_DN7807_c0_g1_i2:89-865(-)
MNDWCQQQIKTAELEKEEAIRQIREEHQLFSEIQAKNAEDSRDQMEQRIRSLQSLLQQESKMLAETREELVHVNSTKTNDMIQFQSKLSSIFTQLDNNELQNQSLVERTKAEMEGIKRKCSSDLHAWKQHHESEMAMQETRIARANQLNDQLRISMERMENEMNHLRQSIQNNLSKVNSATHLLETNSKLDAENILLKEELYLLKTSLFQYKSEIENLEQEKTKMEHILYGHSKRRKPPISSTPSLQKKGLSRDSTFR